MSAEESSPLERLLAGLRDPGDARSQLVDLSVDALAERPVHEALPATWLCGGLWRLKGLNERLRFLRYGRQGDFFHRHRDGCYERNAGERRHPDDVYNIFVRILDALAYLQSRGIIRRDITQWTSGVQSGPSAPVRCPAGSAIATAVDATATAATDTAVVGTTVADSMATAVGGDNGDGGRC